MIVRVFSETRASEEERTPREKRKRYPKRRARERASELGPSPSPWEPFFFPCKSKLLIKAVAATGATNYKALISASFRSLSSRLRSCLSSSAAARNDEVQRWRELLFLLWWGATKCLDIANSVANSVHYPFCAQHLH